MCRKRQWQGDEFMELYYRYPLEGPGRLAIDLGRTVASVDSQASRLRLRSLTRRERQSRTRKRRRTKAPGNRRDGEDQGVEERSRIASRIR